MASYTPDGGTKADFTHLWLLYKHTLYSGDKGAMVVMPTIRLINGSASDPDWSRTKLELTFQLNFK